MKLNHLVKICPILFCLLILSGCRQEVARETTIVPSGTPGMIIDKRNAELIRKDDKNVMLIDKEKLEVIFEGKYTKAVLDGMMVIDKPTLDYYQDIHKLFGKQYTKLKLEALVKEIK